MWILVWICDADVCEFNVEELINRMQCATYAIQTQTIHTHIINMLLTVTCRITTIL